MQQNLKILNEIVDFLLAYNKDICIVWDPILETNEGVVLHKKINKAIEYISYKSLFTHEEKNELFRELPSALKFEVYFKKFYFYLFYNLF